MKRLLLDLNVLLDVMLRRAVALDWPDFEGAVCAAAAEVAGCHAVVTRDPDGFRDSPVRVLDPGTALAWLNSES